MKAKLDDAALERIAVSYEYQIKGPRRQEEEDLKNAVAKWMRFMTYNEDAFSLAEHAAQAFGHEEWMYDEDHWIMDVAGDVVAERDAGYAASKIAGVSEQALADIAASNAEMAIDQDPVDDTKFNRWHHYMGYQENASDTVFERRGTPEQAAHAAKLFNDIVSAQFPDWNTWDGSI